MSTAVSSELDDALHDLAQPLTALSFLTEMARMQSDPELWRQSLESAAEEAKRAMERLRRAREIAARMQGEQ